MAISIVQTKQRNRREPIILNPRVGIVVCFLQKREEAIPGVSQLLFDLDRPPPEQKSSPLRRKNRFHPTDRGNCADSEN